MAVTQPRSRQRTLRREPGRDRPGRAPTPPPGTTTIHNPQHLAAACSSQQMKGSSSRLLTHPTTKACSTRTPSSTRASTAQRPPSSLSNAITINNSPACATLQTKLSNSSNISRRGSPPTSLIRPTYRWPVLTSSFKSLSRSSKATTRSPKGNLTYFCPEPRRRSRSSAA